MLNAESLTVTVALFVILDPPLSLPTIRADLPPVVFTLTFSILTLPSRVMLAPFFATKTNVLTINFNEFYEFYKKNTPLSFESGV